MTSSSLPPSTTTVPSLLTAPVSEKLTKVNYPLWSAQVLPAIRVAQLEDLLLGVEKVPDKEITVVIDGKSKQQRNPAWIARDQAVLGYIMSTLTHETLLHVSWCTKAAGAWKSLAALYLSQSRARSVNTRITLTTTKKNHMSVTDYYTKMLNFVDDLAASGSPLRDDEFVAYLLANLDEEYNPVFTAIVT
jgi:hypothetical protein